MLPSWFSLCSDAYVAQAPFGFRGRISARRARIWGCKLCLVGPSSWQALRTRHLAQNGRQNYLEPRGLRCSEVQNPKPSKQQAPTTIRRPAHNPLFQSEAGMWQLNSLWAVNSVVVWVFSALTRAAVSVNGTQGCLPLTPQVSTTYNTRASRALYSRHPGG